MALEEFIFDNNNVNLIRSLLQILSLGEYSQRLPPKRVAHSELDKRIVALNDSCNPQRMGLTLCKRLDQFLLKRHRFHCACQDSALHVLKGVL